MGREQTGHTSMRAVPLVEGRSIEAIRQRAYWLLGRMGIQRGKAATPHDFLRYCEHQLEDDLGVAFAVAYRSEIGAFGLCDGEELTLRDDVYQTLANGGGGHALFTVAHELGHAVLHARNLILMRHGLSLGTVFRADTHKVFQDPEWQANTFAAEASMPLHAVIEQVQGIEAPAFILANRLQDAMHVSQAAARIRVKQLIEKGWLRVNEKGAVLVARLPAF